MFSKDAARTLMRAARSGISAEDCRTLSREAARFLTAEPVWRAARSVALYMAVRGELCTEELLKTAAKDGKEILLPVCGQPGHMELAAYTGRLSKGAYGIPEPERSSGGPGVIRAEPDGAPDLMVLPGVAFDRAGFRLGMGAGCYDRLLAHARYARTVRIGFAYALQVVDRLPRETWDLPVHALCTEEGVTWIQA